MLLCPLPSEGSSEPKLTGPHENVGGLIASERCCGLTIEPNAGSESKTGSDVSNNQAK